MKKIRLFLITCFSALAVFAANAATVFADDDGGGASTPSNSFGQFLADYWFLIVLVVLVIAWFVYSGFRRKKQVKEGQDMLGSLKPGAFVMTQGGLIGKVVEVIVISPTEKHIVLETGGEGSKTQVTFDIRAVGMVLPPDRLVPKNVEEVAMPSDAEVQKRLDDIYAPDAKKEAAEPVTEEASEKEETK